MKKIATLGYRIKWIFFATSHDKSPCDRVCGLVKRHAAKRSLNQIKFSGTGKETLGGVHKSLVELFSRGNTVPGTQSGHHFIPLPLPKIAHKLSTEDKSYAETHDFNLSTTFQLRDIRPMTCVICLYVSFWWVRFGNPSWCWKRWCQSSIYVPTWAT